MKFPKPGKYDLQVDYEKLSNFRDKYEGYLENVNNKGFDVVESGSVVAYFLLRKLDPTTKANFERARGLEFWTLERFRKIMNDEILRLKAEYVG